MNEARIIHAIERIIELTESGQILRSVDGLANYKEWSLYFSLARKTIIVNRVHPLDVPGKLGCKLDGAIHRQLYPEGERFLESLLEEYDE